MKRATITLSDDLEQALERFVDEQPIPVQLTGVVQTAVSEDLGERGDLPSGIAFAPPVSSSWLEDVRDGSARVASAFGRAAQCFGRWPVMARAEV